jgi:hypothetical protein
MCFPAIVDLAVKSTTSWSLAIFNSAVVAFIFFFVGFELSVVPLVIVGFFFFFVFEAEAVASASASSTFQPTSFK